MFYTKDEITVQGLELVLDDIREFKDKNLWGNINRITFLGIDTKLSELYFFMDCEGHGAFIIYQNDNKLNKYKLPTKFSYKVSKGNQTAYFFEEDCDVKSAFEQLGTEKETAFNNLSF